MAIRRIDRSKAASVGDLLHCRSVKISLYLASICSSFTKPSASISAVIVDYAQVQQMIRFPLFYQSFHNQILAFNLAYQLCTAYEI